MKTPDLIEKLTGELRPAPAGFLAKRAAAFAAGTAAVAVLALALLPLRPDLAGRAHDPMFLCETALWLAASLLSAWLVYESAVPGLWRASRQGPALAVLALMTAVLLGRMFGGSLEAELLREFHWHRGTCGPLILAAGALQSALLFMLARQGAPTRPRVTAFWAAVAAGCLGAFLMQLICYRENALHILVWHFSAIGLVIAADVAAGKRALRW